MPDREEVLSALYGAYRLAWFDVAGMAHFNLTVDGFWRSFFAAVLVAPAYAILVGLQVASGEEAIDPGLLLLGESIGYILAWCAFPLVAIVLTRLLGLGRMRGLVVPFGNSLTLHTVTQRRVRTRVVDARRVERGAGEDRGG